MQIVYVAKHNSGGNDDEGAINHALKRLGHTPILIQEHKGYLVHKRRITGDFLLFHHWADTEILNQIRMPKVSWYFDLVKYQDPTLSARSQARANQMDKVLPLVDLMFCTDGDWVSQHSSDKLIHLFQGADSRIVYFGLPKPATTTPILFAGIRRGGHGRQSFVDELNQTYGSNFVHVRKTHREALATLIQETEVVVAPDAPVTDRYWSNRVYITLGFGGFLLHPYCSGLANHYVEDREIVFYRNRAELHDKISFYRQRPDLRATIQQQGFCRTICEHTYTHRCEQLLKTVRERLL